MEVRIRRRDGSEEILSQADHSSYNPASRVFTATLSNYTTRRFDLGPEGDTDMVSVINGQAREVARYQAGRGLDTGALGARRVQAERHGVPPGEGRKRGVATQATDTPTDREES